VVAQEEMGLNYLSITENNYAIDYMLGTMFFVYYLLFINVVYLNKLDVSRNNILLNSENNNTTISSIMDIKSAENCKGFSETVCQLSEDKKF
jgi:hypothetical protein